MPYNASDPTIRPISDQTDEREALEEFAIQLGLGANFHWHRFNSIPTLYFGVDNRGNVIFLRDRDKDDNEGSPYRWVRQSSIIVESRRFIYEYLSSTMALQIRRALHLLPPR